MQNPDVDFKMVWIYVRISESIRRVERVDKSSRPGCRHVIDNGLLSGWDLKTVAVLAIVVAKAPKREGEDS